MTVDAGWSCSVCLFLVGQGVVVYDVFRALFLFLFFFFGSEGVWIGSCTLLRNPKEASPDGEEIHE